jgi:hypothetical protein
MKTLVRCFTCSTLTAAVLAVGTSTVPGEVLLSVTDDFGNLEGESHFERFSSPEKALQSASTRFRWTGHASNTFFAFLDSGGTLIDS